MTRLARSIIPMFILVLACPVFAEDAPTFASAISGGSYQLQFRYRLESVDEDGFTEDALASVLKTRLTLRSLPYRHVSFLFEVDDVSYLGDDDFNSTRNGNTQYPGVADPSGTDINQLYARWSDDLLTATLGRQRVNLDNERFVGGVGWRQNEQTYDALSVSYGDGGLSGTYAFVNRVSRVFGPDDGAPPPTLDATTHLLNGAWDGGRAGRVSAYAYFLDLTDAPALSTRTFGARYTNAFGSGDITIPVVVEFAQQQEHADNPANISLNYVSAEAGVKSKDVSVLVGFESLEGDGANGFSTPLATGHKFQGWADKFLSTPAAGIEDRWLTVSGDLAGFRSALTWHRFDSDIGGVDYGDELDVSVSRKLSENISLLLKLADYNADTFSTDTRKIWLMLTATF